MWEVVCGFYASTYHDVATYVSHPPVRGGVPDAPRLRDRRAALDAPVRPDRLHPRLIRRANLASTTQRIIFRGRSPRTISHGRPAFSFIPSRAGVEARPYGGWVARVDG